MSQQLVTATVEDGEVRITLPDGSVVTIPHQNRSVAGLLLPEWVADRVAKWSGGELTAVPVEARTAGGVPIPVGTRGRADRVRERHLGGFMAIGEVLGASALVRSFSFSLRPSQGR